MPVFIACPAMQENKAAFPHLMRWADANGILSCVDLFIFNVFCDTAFVDSETIDRIKAAGFTANILFGTDFPITDYVYNNRSGCGTCPSVQDLYTEYVKNTGTFTGI